MNLKTLKLKMKTIMIIGAGKAQVPLIEAAKKAAPDARVIACLHYPPAGPSGRETEFTKLLEKYGVWKCVYGHLHGMPAYNTGIKGRCRGVEYILASFDYLDGVPKLIYDSEA